MGQPLSRCPLCRGRVGVLQRDRGLDTLLLVAGQLGKAFGEGVGEAEFHGVQPFTYINFNVRSA